MLHKSLDLRLLDVIWSPSASSRIQPIYFFVNLFACTTHIRFADVDEMRSEAANELLQNRNDESPVIPSQLVGI